MSNLPVIHRNQLEFTTVTSSDVTSAIQTELLKKEGDLIIDYIDLLSEKVVEHIPIAKTVLGFYKIGESFLAMRNAKKTLTFLQEFHSATIAPAKLAACQTKFDSDPEYRANFMETVMVLNEKFITEKQSAILGNLCRAHMEGKFDFDQFNNLAFIVNNLNPAGYQVLELMSHEPNWQNGQGKYRSEEPLLIACGIASRHGNSFRVTENGQMLFTYGIKPALK